jgi:uncharacterized membrane protein
MRSKTQVPLLLHGLVLLLLAVLPFVFGLYRRGGVLLFLLLLLWPAACVFSPFLLSRSGVRWYFALPLTPALFILPVCVLLTPAGLAYLGAYPVLYGLLAVLGAALGTWRYRKRLAQRRGRGLGL